MSAQTARDRPAFVTAHAADRWDERTPPDAVAPETAWTASTRVRAAARAEGVDEARVHQASGAVLLRRDTSIVTVLSERELAADVQRHITPILEAQ